MNILWIGLLIIGIIIALIKLAIINNRLNDPDGTVSTSLWLFLFLGIIFMIASFGMYIFYSERKTVYYQTGHLQPQPSIHYQSVAETPLTYHHTNIVQTPVINTYQHPASNTTIEIVKAKDPFMENVPPTLRKFHYVS